MAETPVKRTGKRLVKSGQEETAPGQTGGDNTTTAYIPDPELAKRYQHRKIKGVEDFKVLEHAQNKRRNVLLMGDTGAGKTMVGAAYAAEKQQPYYSLPCDVSIDPSALFGRMAPTDVPGKFEWQDGPVTQIVRSGGVLNISEINFMPPKIAASLYPLLDSRRYIPLLGHKGEVVHAHPNLLVIADMNPNYRGTIELNDAFRNRFPIKVKWNYESDVEANLVKSGALRVVAGKLRDMGSEIATPVSTNLLMEFEEMAVDPDLGIDFAIFNFVNAFRASESGAVKNIIDMSKSEIERELGLREADAEDEEELDLSDDEFYYTADGS